jgi:hypothetical protein
MGIALASLPLVAADKEVPLAAAPIPAQVLTAKKLFISNAGVNGIGFAILQRAGDANRPYDLFYAAVKGWGKYEIVDSPSDADLVLEMRFDTVLLGLTILDAKTHFILWSIYEPVEGAALARTWRRNIGTGVANLLRDYQAAVGQPATGGVAKR